MINKLKKRKKAKEIEMFYFKKKNQLTTDKKIV